MKSHCFLIVLLMLALPAVSLASEARFLSTAGKHALSPEVSLVISDDVSGDARRYTLAFSGSSHRIRSMGFFMRIRSATDPFLVHWDESTQIMWWGTPQYIGYADVHNPNSYYGSFRPRVGPDTFPDSDHPFPQPPAIFVTELDRAVPNRQP